MLKVSPQITQMNADKKNGMRKELQKITLVFLLVMNFALLGVVGWMLNERRLAPRRAWREEMAIQSRRSREAEVSRKRWNPSAEANAYVRQRLPLSQVNESKTRKPEISSWLKTMRHVAGWHMMHPSNNPLSWRNALLHIGMMDLYLLSRENRWFMFLVESGGKHEWQLLSSENGPDAQAIGQTYLELAIYLNEPRLASSSLARFDDIMATPRRGREEWWWCDALFMAPPLLARLSAATSDPKYLDFMDKLWWDTSDMLYDPKQRLFYRDKRFLPGTGTEAPVFWGRGNGWVIAGLARVLQFMPKGYHSRQRYETMFRDMANRFAELQPDDGLWRTNLLQSPKEAPGETSVTALTCYAIAWGCREGILDRSKFEPVALLAWEGLVSKVDSDGRLGQMQPPSDRPGPVDTKGGYPYGAGAFLMAGCEMIRLKAESLPADDAD